MGIVELPPELVLKIAAGEVVERPASVAKELLENSLDACAERIEVDLRGGGIIYLRVTDDGQGIPPEEAELAFRRHATSKLSDLKDLSQIASLGFRGEALPSIAAVAEVSMLTRTRDQPLGVFLRLRDGSVAEQGQRGCPPGTTVTVRGLFSTLPARRKFLRPPAAEGRRVADVVARYCLAYPEVQFLLHSDGRLALQSSGDGQLTTVFASLYGPGSAKLMVPLETRDGSLAIQGLVSPPSESRASRQAINFFINRRWVQNAFLLRALEEAYADLLPKDRHPLAVINLHMPPEDVDVNMHPAKREVRFYREGEVYALVRGAVRRALGGFAPAKTGFQGFGLPAPSTLGQIPAPFGSFQTPTSAVGSYPPDPLRLHLPILRVVGQMSNVYIIAEGPDGMYLVDQHTAHERVLYEGLKAGGEVNKQGLLDPLVLDVPPVQASLLASMKEELDNWGFELEPLDQNAWLLRTVPSLLKEANLKEALQEVLAALEDSPSTETRRERLRQSIACHAAVRAGKALTHQEMRELLLALEATELPYTCPHGRPTMVYLSAARLAKEFGRD